MRQFDFDVRKEIAEQVKEWLNDYDMPVNILSVVTALNSLDYLNKRPTPTLATAEKVKP